MSTVVIVQARISSTRLPGKVLKKVLGKPLLEYQIERLRKVASADKIVIATTINSADQPIVNLCERLSVPCFRGPEEDVLTRYHGAAIQHKADVIVRITSDCPIIDPNVIDRIIGFYMEHKNEYDYISNTIERTFPRGMDTEVFPFKTLGEIFIKANDQSDREHVTPYIYRHPNRYRLACVTNFENQSHHRWTVDTIEDFNLISRFITTLYPENPAFGFYDCLALVEKNPALQRINAHIEQKEYGS